MGIMSIEQVDHLYWLGRYAERVYTTIRYYSVSYDAMIDENEDSYQKFCDSIDIPNIYESKIDFLMRYPFDERIPDSIMSNLNRAYDNAIVLRESIGSEALSYIQLCIYALKKAATSEAPLLEMQQVMDYIYSFWGNVDDQIDSEPIRNIMKAGKRIERIDLYARLGLNKAELANEVKRLIPRVVKSGIRFNEENLKRLSVLVSEDFLDNKSIIECVESIIEL